MAGGMNKRGSGIPMHQRVALSRPSSASGSAEPGVPPPGLAPAAAWWTGTAAEPPRSDGPPSEAGPGPRTDTPGVDPPPLTGRHCWVLAPADGSGERRPGLLVEWRRSDDGSWLGRVVYVVRLRTGRSALLDEWLPAYDLSPL
ncbi:MAG: hypothetical protein ACTHKG_12700 [Nocardioides sp.]